MTKTLGVCYIFEDFHPAFSGHSVYMLQIMARLIDRGVKVSVICRNPGGEPARETFRGIDIYRIDPTLKGVWRDLRIVKGLMEMRGNFHCIHINSFADRYSLILLMARLSGKRVILQSTLYGCDDAHTFLRTHVGGKLRLNQVKALDAVTAISKPLIQTYLDRGFSREKLVYIQQGVELDRFRPATPAIRSDLRRKMGYSEDERIVLFVGTILERKGVDWLIEAWEQVSRKLGTCRLVLVGMDYFDHTHQNRESLNRFVEAQKARVADGNLPVDFVGLKDDVNPYYLISNILVLPSRKEGFGNVIVEAMASGLPCIVTPMDGVAHETIVDGANGYIVEDVDELADRLANLLSHPKLEAAMGAKGLEMARDRFDMEKIMLQYLDLYAVPRG